MSGRGRNRSLDLAEMQQLAQSRPRLDLDQPSTLPSHLPAQPLLAVVQGRGGIAPCLAGVDCAQRRQQLERALWRASVDGQITWKTADRLAIEVLGLHPFEVWGDDWLPTDPPGLPSQPLAPDSPSHEPSSSSMHPLHRSARR